MKAIFKIINRQKKSIYHFLIMIFSVLCTFAVFANPVVQNIQYGNITIQNNSNQTTIHQTSQKGIINWNSFNINSNQQVHFQQPSNGITLNRINAQNGVSEIYGRLTATGEIILINPAGIYFGPNAFVNVSSLIASTADLTNKNFINSNYTFED